MLWYKIDFVIIIDDFLSLFSNVILIKKIILLNNTFDKMKKVV
jgi:hypothetical protein